MLCALTYHVHGVHKRRTPYCVSNDRVVIEPLSRADDAQTFDGDTFGRQRLHDNFGGRRPCDVAVAQPRNRT